MVRSLAHVFVFFSFLNGSLTHCFVFKSTVLCDNSAEAKGKGQMQTYWLAPKGSVTSSDGDSMGGLTMDSLGSLGGIPTVSTSDDTDSSDKPDVVVADPKKSPATRVLTTKDSQGMLEVEV